MSKQKLNFGKGFSVAHHTPKQTAMDKFQAAEAFINSDERRAEPSNNEKDFLPLLEQQETPKASSGSIAISPAFANWCRDNSYTPGSLIRLKLDDAKPSRFNPRHFYSRQSISTLAVNLHSQQQQQPILVTPDYDSPGKYFVVDGGRRIKALRESKDDTFLARVVDVPHGIESYKLGFDLNTQHETQTVFDDAIVWKQMMDENLFPSQTALAEFLGVDKSAVTATLSIGDLPLTVIETMVEYPAQFGMNMAYNLAKFFRVKGEKATSDLIQRVIAEGLSVRKVAEIAKKATEEVPTDRPPRTRYAERVEVRFDDDVQLGTLQTYADGRLELKLKGMSREQTNQVHKRLQEVLAEFKTQPSH